VSAPVAVSYRERPLRHDANAYLGPDLAHSVMPGDRHHSPVPVLVVQPLDH
jgi:hypothetical protein